MIVKISIPDMSIKISRFLTVTFDTRILEQASLTPSLFQYMLVLI